MMSSAVDMIGSTRLARWIGLTNLYFASALCYRYGSDSWR